MEAVRLPIAQDATAPLIPEKKVEIGIVRERGNIDTRTDIAHAPTLTGAKGRGAAYVAYVKRNSERSSVREHVPT